MTEYVAYYRVSTSKQDMSGLGLAAQKRDIGLFMEHFAGDGSEIVAEFQDIDSGTNDARTNLGIALDEARRTGATLIVATLTRLSRDVHFITGLMKDKRLKFVVAATPHADKNMLMFYAIVAEMERDFISLRTKVALREARERGVKLGGLRGSTAERNEAKAKIADQHAERLRQIVVPMRQVGKTLLQVCEALNVSGHLTPRGCQWTPTQIRRVLARLEAA